MLGPPSRGSAIKHFSQEHNRTAWIGFEQWPSRLGLPLNHSAFKRSTMLPTLFLIASFSITISTIFFAHGFFSFFWGLFSSASARDENYIKFALVSFKLLSKLWRFINFRVLLEKLLCLFKNVWFFCEYFDNEKCNCNFESFISN